MAATNAPVTRQQPSSWRRWVPWVLVVLAAVIGLVSALNIWVKRQALDTNNFTNASVQMLEDPQVRSAISIYLVDQLYQNVDVAAELEQQLPPAVRGSPLRSPVHFVSCSSVPPTRCSSVRACRSCGNRQSAGHIRYSWP